MLLLFMRLAFKLRVLPINLLHAFLSNSKENLSNFELDFNNFQKLNICKLLVFEYNNTFT